MNVQELLGQCCVEDIVRVTMEVYHVDAEHYGSLYDNYTKLVDTLLQLDATPSDNVLLGIDDEDAGEPMLDTTLYHLDQLRQGIAYHEILEKTTDPAELSSEVLDDAIHVSGWPEGYSYMFDTWAEVMGYAVNEKNLEDVGSVPFLVDVLYELTFFGYHESDMEAERQKLEETSKEVEVIRARPEEEQAGYFIPLEDVMDELREDHGMAPRPIPTPEEKAQQEQAVLQEIFRNKQHTYRALRKYGGKGVG